MEKVKLPREVAEAITHAKEIQESNQNIVGVHCADGDWTGICEPLNYINLDTLIRALYIGYEVEQTPHEKLAEWYTQLKKADIPKRYGGGLLAPLPPRHHKMEAIRQTLKILDIKVKGINA